MTAGAPDVVHRETDGGRPPMTGKVLARQPIACALKPMDYASAGHSVCANYGRRDLSAFEPDPDVGESDARGSGSQ